MSNPHRSGSAAEGLGEVEKVHNNDMHIAEARLELLGMEVRTAAGDPTIEGAFDRFEAKAVRAKRLHDRLGMWSLIFLMVALESALFRIAAPGLAPGWVVQLMLLTGLLPIGAGVLAHVWKVHDQWILARCKAERVRHWKFQQLMEGAYVQALPQSFDAAWLALMEDLDGGWARRSTFLEESAPPPLFVVQGYTDRAVFLDAMGIYKVYRLELQRNWFTQEKDRYIAIDDRSEALAKNLLVAGALMAFGEPVLHWMGEAHLGHLLAVSGLAWPS